MANRSRTCSECRSGLKRPLSWLSQGHETLRPALRLVGTRQCLSLLWLIAERVAVGLCDLLLAGGMYLLLLLLQGTSPTHHRWWTPTTTLSAASITAALVVLRAVMDLASTRSVISHMQSLYTAILLKLTRGYNQMKWLRFAQRNRSELLNHTMSTARDAANFYHLGVEMTAATTVVAAMTIALIYRSPPAACGLGITVMMFYGVHRLLIRKKLQRSASEREQSLLILQKSLADMFSSGKEIRSYGTEEFFHDRISGHARSASASHQRVALFPQIARILADQGVMLLFLCIVIAVQLLHGDPRRLLSLLVFYFVLSRRLLPLVSQISFMAGQMEGSYKSVQVVSRELDDCFIHRTDATAVQKAEGKAVLQLDQVSFSFCKGSPILRNVTLSLQPGEAVVLHGVSGSGKSSLLNLIAGVLQPATGVVRVDRESVAYVPQDTALLDDSIRNNLLFGLPAKSNAELMKALAVANLGSLLPRSLGVLILASATTESCSPGGSGKGWDWREQSSAAQACSYWTNLLQRWMRRSESRVLENLRDYGMAVLLVTHRVLRPGFAQRVFWLRDGHLIEEAIREPSVA